MKPIHTINNKQNQAYGINTARTSTLGLLQIFRYYNMGLTLRNASPISQTVISTGDFVLMPEHVRAMFHTAKDLRSKLLESMGTGMPDTVAPSNPISEKDLMLVDTEPISIIKTLEESGNNLIHGCFFSY
jgi:hypothetical protein